MIETFDNQNRMVGSFEKQGQKVHIVAYNNNLMTLWVRKLRVHKLAQILDLIDFTVLFYIMN